MARERSKEEAILVINTLVAQSARIVKTMYEKYGDEAVDILRENNFKIISRYSLRLPK